MANHDEDDEAPRPEWEPAIAELADFIRRALDHAATRGIPGDRLRARGLRHLHDLGWQLQGNEYEYVVGWALDRLDDAGEWWSEEGTAYYLDAFRPVRSLEPRQAFARWAGGEALDLQQQGRVRTALWDDSAAMPEALCERMGLPNGSSYAEGLREQNRDHRLCGHCHLDPIKYAGKGLCGLCYAYEHRTGKLPPEQVIGRRDPERRAKRRAEQQATRTRDLGSLTPRQVVAAAQALEQLRPEGLSESVKDGLAAYRRRRSKAE